MLRMRYLWLSAFAFALVVGVVVQPAGAACVWKVTGPGGKTLYLGGSMHQLRSTDYPLPPAFNRAFDAASRLVGEVDRKSLVGASQALIKSGEYPKGDSLKNHVDPRTYDYLRRVFAIVKVPEERFSKLRPWLLVLFLQASNGGGFSDDLGVESFLFRRADANSKPVTGLESMREHAEVFSGLNDRQSEALLLLAFIPQKEGGENGARIMEAWRRGDADEIARLMHQSFRDFPAFGERILEARNRKWLPKVERYLLSGQTYFVVVGAAHMGGPGGLLSLLRGRGYQIEQL